MDAQGLYGVINLNASDRPGKRRETMKCLGRGHEWLQRRTPRVLLRPLAASTFLPFPAYTADGGTEAVANTGIGIAVMVGLVATFGLTSLIMPRRLLNFWVKSLMSSVNVEEQCAAAKEMSRIRDPRALLTLFDVADDEEKAEEVRKAAGKALHEMSSRYPKYPKYRNTIKELESSMELKNPQAVINVLTAAFETNGKKYTQSAWVIGRQYMKLGQYADAREWLRKAKVRARKTMLYEERILQLINACNERLLADGDGLFKASNYHRAKVHYALLSQGLDESEKRRYAIYLRSACAYCKLNDYVDANQAILHALRSHQETDSSLTLITLLQKLASRAEEERDGVQNDIDECVSDIMNRLTAQGYGAVESFTAPEKIKTPSWMEPPLAFPRLHASLRRGELVVEP